MRDFERSKGSGRPQVDLHGSRPADALRKVAQALHAARVQGAEELRIVTGRGWGNVRQEPVLRRQVEAWLRGAEGRRAGAGSFQVVSKGGALDVRLTRTPPPPPGGDGD